MNSMIQSIVRRVLLLMLTVIPIASISFAAKAALNMDGLNNPTDSINASGSGESGSNG